MKKLLAELDAEDAAAQSKSSKSSRKKNKKKGLPDAPGVRNLVSQNVFIDFQS